MRRSPDSAALNPGYPYPFKLCAPFQKSGLPAVGTSESLLL